MMEVTKEEPMNIMISRKEYTQKEYMGPDMRNETEKAITKEEKALVEKTRSITIISEEDAMSYKACGKRILNCFIASS